MSMTLLTAAVLLGQVDVQRGIVYDEVAGKSLAFDSYMPELPAAQPAPVVVVIHGGGWMSGKREDMASVCAELATEGLAAATISYRLAPKHKMPAMIEDARSAVMYLRSHAEELGIDGDRMAALGVSAGGHLALLLGTQEIDGAKVDTVVNIFGPTDMAHDFNPLVINALSSQVLGKPAAKAAAEIALYSPVTHVNAGDAAVFTIHGAIDKLVPVQQAKRLDEAMDKAGVPHDLRIIEGMGHALPVDQTELRKALADALEFLKSRLTRQ